MKRRSALYCVIITVFIRCGQTSTGPCNQFIKFQSVVKNDGMAHDTAFLLKKYTEIIELDSSCVDSYLTRANLLFSIDSIKSALQDYQKALTLDTSNVYCLYRIGVINQELERDQVAIEYFRKAIKLKTNGNVIVSYSPDGIMSDNDKSKYDVQAELLIYAQGLSFYYARMLDSALIKFNFCIANKYYLDKSYFQRGVIYWEMRQDDKACNDFLAAQKFGSIRATELIDKYCSKKYATPKSP